MSPQTTPDVAALPKVVLHDHLDGGLRPGTLVELAGDVGHALPTTDPQDLAAWFVQAASSGSLERYLETFDNTVAAMQTEPALRRVAREAVLDLAADGVVHAELRYAPEQHLTRGLSLDDVVRAVQAGLTEGIATAAEQGQRISVGTLLTAMRHADRSPEIAELALAFRDDGVVGFDLAGAEVGFPPSKHEAALRRLRTEGFPVTLHAGEAAGVDSIAEALHVGMALRIGHGVRVVEDIEGIARRGDDEPRLGRVARWVLDNQVPLELCPTSNVQTGAATSVALHPITDLKRHGFAVTVNTDNRLQSGTSMTREMDLLVQEAGWTVADLCDVTLTAAWHAFLPYEERVDLVDEVILPGYAGG